MSSTTSPVRAGSLDSYYTPPEVARACVALLPLRHANVWEPHAGGGAFFDAIFDTGAGVLGSDLDAGERWVKHDALTGPPDGYVPDWIVGNPPFNAAEDHIRMALEHARVGVGFLLRLAFLEGAKRRAFWAEHPAAEVHVLVTRPRFTGKGTDSAAYGFFVWRRDGHVATTLHHLDWRSA